MKKFELELDDNTAKAFEEYVQSISEAAGLMVDAQTMNARIADVLHTLILEGLDSGELGDIWKAATDTSVFFVRPMQKEEEAKQA